LMVNISVQVKTKINFQLNRGVVNSNLSRKLLLPRTVK
jgi:hypothetical protein